MTNFLRRNPYATEPDSDFLLEKPTSLWKGAFGRLRRRRTGQIGMVLIGGLILMALLAPLIAPFAPNEVLIGKEEGVKRRTAPCYDALDFIGMFRCDSEDQPQHLLGTDGNVRDEFSRVVYGSRISLLVGITVVVVAVTIGALLGSIAGFWSGWADNIIMRIMDVVLGFPSFLLAIAIVAVLGPGIRNAMLGVVIVSIPVYARVMRAGVLSIKELDYVAASRSLGASSVRILWTRVVPNALTPLVVLATLGLATAILDVAGLSFLGLGAQPPSAEWGTMLASERNQVFTAPHLVFFPGLMIMLTVLGFNLLGDGLRDALDPSLQD
ncbi:MAG: ABC transporter permease [Acidimicrobiia bacterium]|nr:ABC transporter permease [Acidimicrobiia bacterium]